MREARRSSKHFGKASGCAGPAQRCITSQGRALAATARLLGSLDALIDDNTLAALCVQFQLIHKEKCAISLKFARCCANTFARRSLENITERRVKYDFRHQSPSLSASLASSNARMRGSVSACSRTCWAWAMARTFGKMIGGATRSRHIPFQQPTTLAGAQHYLFSQTPAPL